MGGDAQQHARLHAQKWHNPENAHMERVSRMLGRLPRLRWLTLPKRDQDHSKPPPATAQHAYALGHPLDTSGTDWWLTSKMITSPDTPFKDCGAGGSAEGLNTAY